MCDEQKLELQYASQTLGDELAEQLQSRAGLEDSQRVELYTKSLHRLQEKLQESSRT
ncbi:MAG: hypothetical protein Q3961_03535 [Bifidobacteriaceae bacterium]|nr:hypothetical protein [Bifidobacteriaceae bacterium]